MKRIVYVPTLAIALAAGALAQTAADLPTVDQILAKNIEASGGKAALEKLNSRVEKGTIEVVTFGVSGPIEMYAKAPNKQFSRSTFEGYGEVLQGFDGKTGWVKTPDAGLREMSGAELDRAKRSADFHRSLHLKEQYAKMTVIGKGKVGDRDASSSRRSSRRDPRRNSTSRRRPACWRASKSPTSQAGRPRPPWRITRKWTE